MRQSSIRRHKIMEPTIIKVASYWHFFEVFEVVEDVKIRGLVGTTRFGDEMIGNCFAPTLIDPSILSKGWNCVVVAGVIVVVAVVVVGLDAMKLGSSAGVMMIDTKRPVLSDPQPSCAMPTTKSTVLPTVTGSVTLNFGELLVEV
jgi:hypothetical protein